MDKQQLCSKIKKWQSAKGVTNYALAAELGMDISHLRQTLNKHKSISTPKCQHLRNFFHNRGETGMAKAIVEYQTGLSWDELKSIVEPAPDLTTVFDRHGILVDKKFLGGLSDTEAKELETIAGILDTVDTEHYKIIIVKLEAITKKLGGQYPPKNKGEGRV